MLKSTHHGLHRPAVDPYASKATRIRGVCCQNQKRDYICSHAYSGWQQFKHFSKRHGRGVAAAVSVTLNESVLIFSCICMYMGWGELIDFFYRWVIVVVGEGGDDAVGVVGHYIARRPLL